MTSLSGVRRPSLAGDPRGRMGLDRGTGLGFDPADEDDVSESVALMRSYRRDMRVRNNGRVPSMGDIIGGAYAAASSEDDGRRRLLLDGLTRTGTESLGGGQAYGFVIPAAYSHAILDRAREIDGPWARCRWVSSPTIELRVPVTAETSLANGKRFGGLTSTWGTPEVVFPPATDGKLAVVTYKAQRLPVLTVVSRDLMADSDLIAQWLQYQATTEIRYNIEYAMINGMDAVGGPQGVLTAPSTVTVPPDSGQAAATITATNINRMWGAIAPACMMSPGLCWHASPSTIEAIDDLAVSGDYPELNYARPGQSYWSPHALLKGRPLIPSAFCPDVGTPGDLIAVDWSQYMMMYVRPKREASPLTVAFPSYADADHLGEIGLPSDSIWGRMSDQAYPYFFNDLVAIAWTIRASGGFLWTSTSQDAQGNVIGPAAIIAAR